MIKTSDEKQLTLKSAFKLKGRALHSGMDIEVCVKPAPAGSGISFKRTDQADARALPALIESVNGSVGKGRQTTLGSGQESISTIEHLMAAFHGMGVDNASVEVSGPEIPGLDGSADEICQAIERAGLEAQERAREYLQVEEPVAVNFSNASVVILPSKDFKISYTLNYSSGALDDQFFEESITPEKFRQEIAPARTFVLKEEAEALMAAGYGKGADFGNTLVFENNQPMNNELRFPNEAARHKVLDLIGDLYLLGRRIKGHVIASRTGHAQNLKNRSITQKWIGKFYEFRAK